ncbi:HEAT repeat protein [Aquisphaera giovannonii]|uniref:HEAT repeat protein n=1 Tax=Aquisphaera giovannonii TaxID=406548 RepID=A0A5B9WA07_9BACT|nr:HEAT repeat domain-containing protein [Aquisphaera giovannonii]QEH37458.1 HEAT repeat protein [Aquisphaera giovannonii]
MKSPPRILLLAAILLPFEARAEVIRAETGFPTTVAVQPGPLLECRLGTVQAGRTYRFGASIAAPADTDASLHVNLRIAGVSVPGKSLHAGDPDVSIHVRAQASGPAEVRLRRKVGGGPNPREVRLDWAEVPLADDERAAIEAEPNNSWQEANPLRLGRVVYGSGDDVDYLANPSEGRTGIDWFRFEVAGDRPVLATFHLDLLDRDISANMRVYTLDPRSREPVPYLAGKDPTEIVHDRERERYSTFLTRTLARGTYYLEVNANHPAYVLRTRTFPTPPYEDPKQAVEAGLHYILGAGDAWFAQVPRAGNIYARADNIHDTGTRCTGCHASSFPLEAGLAAHRSGYAIRDRDAFQYLADRLASSVTPLYGDDGLYWQRYIASPLQSQGLQGGLVADIEREVTGRQTVAAGRFAPFLKAAWLDRKELPEDEQNAVVPVDSKFGAAWRDWRVLKDAARRTGREEYAKAAANLAAVVCSQRSDLRAENLQDRINRLIAWSLMDREGSAGKIRRESNRLIALQNSDGGWHESSDGPGPSAVYATGQLVDALLTAGLPPDHPAIARALRYLLSQQQGFGGWFQTTTHENFRTPMRETLHAVTALARAYPAKGGPLRSWGNRDGGPARPPRADSIVHTLDDLEGLWDVPEADCPRLAREVAVLLGHPEPMVRAAAATCLGRIGRGESAAPLAKSLGDPSKVVWRAAAWSLRRIGNGGEGLDEIRRVLASPEPAERRGAARIFAYQFAGLDDHLDLGDRLVELTRDPDLWTRLQAVKSLRQWFYRTNDDRFRRRIVDAFLERMGEPVDPVIRKNLVEGLYIMLDENLGGGISLQHNLAVLPSDIRSRVLKARADLERDVLLTPILGVLERGDARQRSAVLAAFDGSFLGGRDYARQPEAALDIGNDREFGFLYEVPTEPLDRAFAAILGDATLDPISRRRAIQLCRFFKLPGRTANEAIQSRLLAALWDGDSGVREAARDAVGRDLALAGAEDDPARIASLCAVLAPGKSSDVRSPALAAIGRNARLASRPEIRRAIHALVGDAGASADLLPVIGQADFTADERLAVIDRGWPRLAAPRRIEALDVLLALSGETDRPEPTPRALSILRRAAADPSAEVREHLIEGIGRRPTLRAGAAGASLLLGALADDEPAIRRLGLALTSSSTAFWDRPDAQEHLARLLLDPDAAVRSDALDLTRHHRLAARVPAIAARVKALMADAALAPRAEAILRAAGLEPDRVRADANLAALREPNLEAFRRRINPLLYRPSADGQSCASCHGSHAVLRVAPVAPGKEPRPEEVLVNYRSALKVINVGRPESSLLLRKPRSPVGAGLPDASSPTGLTHAGGTRWEGPDDEAYRSILDWIRNPKRP